MANAQNWKREREQYQAAWAKYQMPNTKASIVASRTRRPPRKIYRSYRKPGKSLRTLVSALVSITMSSMSGIWPKVKACDFVEHDRAILRKR